MYLYFSDFLNVPITRLQLHHLTQLQHPRGGPSAKAPRWRQTAASLAALSLCLQAISRCVSAPLNSSRGKSIKAGVRGENPIKRCAWFPQHERSPRGFIQVWAPWGRFTDLYKLYHRLLPSQCVPPHALFALNSSKAIKALSTIS